MRSFLINSLLVALASSIAVPKPGYVSYDGYKVFRVKTQGQLDIIRHKLSSLAYDEWSQEPTHLDIAISPDELSTFESLGLDSHCMHENLGASIRAETSKSSIWKRQVDDMSWFDNYHPYEDHMAYFDDLHSKFPDNSEMVSSGTSYEGRDIFGIHLWGAEGPGKPAVLWHGTVHAREWITAMVIEYLSMQLVTGYASDNVTTSFVDNYDFYIFPFVNPDGFVYTQTNERLWRKNRMPPPPDAENQTCFGRDVNRQWPYMWDANPEGASPNPCSQTYKGETPSDSPENQGLVAFVDHLRDTQGIKLYIDWHSYGQYILSPWGYNCTVYDESLGRHIKLAALTGDAIREGANGTTFTFGPSCSTLYATTGSSVDYIYGVGNSDWSYTIELRDTGDYGFVLPPQQIRGAAEEQWAGMQVMLSLLNEVFFDNEGPVIGSA
ncbi:hypothetical protein OHC33_006605 [Knufia fluminis]|uniref:Peptidase M14 domain-containing protein n=1 Tax=Knufia fluminis TaxID=191047 RepID=A0AAN8ECU2_9EURO|nr:hypothetical protein OHC33_006605 [Knufia fluminis]